MPESPAINDTFNDLLFKLAQNLYERGVSLGKTGLQAPRRGWTDQELLKVAVINSAAIAS